MTTADDMVPLAGVGLRTVMAVAAAAEPVRRLQEQLARDDNDGLAVGDSMSDLPDVALDV